LFGQRLQEQDNAPHFLMVAVYCCAIVATMSAAGLQLLGIWISAGALSVGAAALVANWWYQSGRHIWRNHRMKKPQDAYVTGPDGQPSDTCYLPANHTGTIHLQLIPRLTYKEHELRIGFTGNPEYRPHPKNFVDRFVKEWVAGKDSDKRQIFTDIKGTLHRKGTIEKVEGNTYVLDVLVETGNPGKYEMKIWSYTESGTYKLPRKIWLVVTYPKEAISSKDQT